jgi:hypothetical protein
MAAVAKDISGLRLSFAIRAAIFTIFPSVAVATWMGALLLGFHTLYIAFRVPDLVGASETDRRPKAGLSESSRGRRFWDLVLAKNI